MRFKSCALKQPLKKGLSMEIITLIFDALGEVATSVISWFTAIFSGVAEIFYTPGVEGAPGTLTLFGVLALIGVGVSAFYFILRWILRLIKINPKG